MNVLKAEITDAGFLMALIPQRQPFIMIDKLMHFSEKKIISGLKVLPDNILSEGNGFTASGLIENMAQTIALHTGYSYYLLQKPAPKGYIGSIKKAEIFRLPLVFQHVVTTVCILHDIMGVTMVEAKVECNGELIATSEMKTALVN